MRTWEIITLISSMNRLQRLMIGRKFRARKNETHSQGGMAEGGIMNLVFLPKEEQDV